MFQISMTENYIKSFVQLQNLLYKKIIICTCEIRITMRANVIKIKEEKIHIFYVNITFI